MDPLWIGSLSTLAGVVVAGGISIVRDVLGEKRQTRRDTAQREHEISEARYEARRDAYVTFGAACHRALQAASVYEREHGYLPGEAGHEGPHKEVSEAQDLINVIGPQEAASAAASAALAVSEYAFTYGSSNYDDAWDAIQEFAEVARRLLKFDVVEGK